jgi:hypothetical protein
MALSRSALGRFLTVISSWVSRLLHGGAIRTARRTVVHGTSRTLCDVFQADRCENPAGSRLRRSRPAHPAARVWSGSANVGQRVPYGTPEATVMLVGTYPANHPSVRGCCRIYSRPRCCAAFESPLVDLLARELVLDRRGGWRSRRPRRRDRPHHRGGRRSCRPRQSVRAERGVQAYARCLTGRFRTRELAA